MPNFESEWTTPDPTKTEKLTKSAKSANPEESATNVRFIVRIILTVGSICPQEKGVRPNIYPCRLKEMMDVMKSLDLVDKNGKMQGGVEARKVCRQELLKMGYSEEQINRVVSHIHAHPCNSNLAFNKETPSDVRAVFETTENPEDNEKSLRRTCLFIVVASTPETFNVANKSLVCWYFLAMIGRTKDFKDPLNLPSWNGSPKEIVLRLKWCLDHVPVSDLWFGALSDKEKNVFFFGLIHVYTLYYRSCIAANSRLSIEKWCDKVWDEEHHCRITGKWLEESDLFAVLAESKKLPAYQPKISFGGNDQSDDPDSFPITKKPRKIPPQATAASTKTPPQATVTPPEKPSQKGTGNQKPSRTTVALPSATVAPELPATDVTAVKELDALNTRVCELEDTIAEAERNVKALPPLRKLFNTMQTQQAKNLRKKVRELTNDFTVDFAGAAKEIYKAFAGCSD